MSSTRTETDTDYIGTLAPFRRLAGRHVFPDGLLDAAGAPHAPVNSVTIRPAANLDAFYVDVTWTPDEAMTRLFPSRVCIMISDISGSMATHVSEVFATARHLVECAQNAKLPMGRFFLIFFDDSARVVDAADPEALLKINRIRGGGSTSYRSALTEVIKIFNDARASGSPDSRINFTVFFVTDGGPNGGDGWERSWDEIERIMGGHDENCFIPFFFGQAASYMHRPSYTHGPMRVLRSMCIRAEPQLINFEQLCRVTRDSVTVMATDIQCVFAGVDHLTVSLFLTDQGYRGTTVVSPEQMTPEQIRMLCGMDIDCMIRVQGGQDTTLYDSFSVVLDETPRPLEEEQNGARGAIVSRMAANRVMLEEASRGNRDALTRTIELLDELRAMYSAMHVRPNDPMFVALKNAHDITTKLVARFAVDGRGTAITASRGDTDLVGLLQQLLWNRTEATGKDRKNGNAARKVLTIVLQTREKTERLIKDIEAALEGLLLAPRGHVVGTPEDFVTNDEITSTPVLILTGPGSSISSLTDALDNTLMLAAVNNAGGATGWFQAVLNLETFLLCVRRGLPILGATSIGLFCLPFHHRTAVQEDLVRAIAGLTAMQLICGVTAPPAESAAAVFPAIAFSILSDCPERFHVPGALALANYYLAMVSRQRRDGVPVMDILPMRLFRWSGVQWSSTTDNTLSTVQMATMVAAFLALWSAKPMPRRIEAVLFTTAQRAVAHRVTLSGGPQRLSEEYDDIVNTLATDLVRESNATARNLLDGLAGHLANLPGRLVTVGPEQLERILKQASCVTIRDSIPITHDDATVAKARGFLWGLASEKVARPAVTVHAPVETWRTILRLVARLGNLIDSESVARADANGGWFIPDDVERFFAVGNDIPDDDTALIPIFTPLETLWLALLMIKTQGNTGKIRDLGEDIGPGDGPDIDRDFWATYMRDTSRVREADSATHRALMREMVDLAIERVAHRDLRPEVLAGLYVLVARKGYEGMMIRLIRALCSYEAVTVTSVARRTMLLRLPSQAVVTTIKPIQKEILRVIELIATRVSAKDAYANVPASLIALPQVQEVLRRAGISQVEIDLRLGAPGATPAIPNSRRMNHHLRNIARNAGVDVNTPIPEGEEVVVVAHGEGGGNTYVLPLQYHHGTLFAPPHNATRIHFRGYGPGGPFVAYRVVFADGTVQARDPSSDDAEKRRWSTDWRVQMNEWRMSVLRKRDVVSPPPDVEARAGGAPKPPVTEMSIDDARDIQMTVQELLDALPDAHTDPDDDDGDW